MMGLRTDRARDDRALEGEATMANKAEPDRGGPRVGKQVAALFDLSGKIAVIADKGLMDSREVALLLADAGATIVMADVEVAKGEALAAEIEKAGGRAVFIKTDVEVEADVVQLFEAVQKTFNRVDILVYGAGGWGSTYLTNISGALWDRIQSVNLKGLFFCVREALKGMVAAGNGGQIVNLNTIGCLNPVMNGNGAYGAARAGAVALLKTTSLDYAKHKIRCNVIAVGAIKDRIPLLEVPDPPFTGPAQDGPHRTPWGPGDMDDVAAAALYLVSPASRYVTGTVLLMDGGFMLT